MESFHQGCFLHCMKSDGIVNLEGHENKEVLLNNLPGRTGKQGNTSVSIGGF